MVSGVNQKIIGAIVVGAALVAGAYTLVNFGVGKPLPANVSGAVAVPARVAITVEDKDQNGIEDWRDSFFSDQQFIINTGSSTAYLNTQTGRLGVNLLEEAIRSKHSGALADSQEAIVNDQIDSLVSENSTPLLDLNDIIIMETWTDTDIKTYANALAQIILNSQPRGDTEYKILQDIVLQNKSDRIQELVAIRDNYAQLRDQSKALPVPKPFVKTHLDLLNTYDAIYHDVSAMTLLHSDPIVTLLRLRRYPDDLEGLRLALENVNETLQEYKGIFNEQDPATIFSYFNSNMQR